MDVNEHKKLFNITLKTPIQAKEPVGDTMYSFHIMKKFKQCMVNNSTHMNKANNHPSPLHNWISKSNIVKSKDIKHCTDPL
jgi:hypothetical protein